MTLSPNRRWSFSLRTVFLLTVVAGWFCAISPIRHTQEMVMISNHAGMEIERRTLNPALIWPTFALLAIIAWNVVSTIRARHRDTMAAVSTATDSRWSFSLRTLFIVVTVVAIAFGGLMFALKSRWIGDMYSANAKIQLMPISTPPANP